MPLVYQVQHKFDVGNGPLLCPVGPEARRGPPPTCDPQDKQPPWPMGFPILVSVAHEAKRSPSWGSDMIAPRLPVRLLGKSLFGIASTSTK